MSVDLSSWEEKIHADPDDEVNDIDDSLPSEEKEGHEMFKDGVLTIGCVGKYMIFMYFVRHYHRYITIVQLYFLKEYGSLERTDSSFIFFCMKDIQMLENPLY